MTSDDLYQKLRTRVVKSIEKKSWANKPWAEILLAGPDLLHLLFRLLKDPRVPFKQKAKLGAALIYFLSPVELLPEIVLGPIGLIDDIAFAAYALHSVINEIDPELVREHWVGKGEAIDVIQRVLAQTNQWIGSGVWEKVTRRFRRWL